MNNIHNLTYKQLEKEMKDIGKKKLQDLNKSDIYKFLIIKEELDWVNNNYSPDMFTFDGEEVDRLVDVMNDHIFDYFNNDLFYYNDIHSEIEGEEE